MIEVGTGIVLRKRNVPSVACNGIATFNGATYPLKHRVVLLIRCKNSEHIHSDFGI